MSVCDVIERRFLLAESRFPLALIHVHMMMVQISRLPKKIEQRQEQLTKIIFNTYFEAKIVLATVSFPHNSCRYFIGQSH
jgi:hypothetical protein